MNNFPFRLDFFAAVYSIFVAIGVGNNIPIYILIGLAPAFLSGIVGYEILKPRPISDVQAAPVPIAPINTPNIAGG
jgi:hypothetical protein